MKRRKFIYTVPVLAAGVSTATPLLANQSTFNGTSAQQELFEAFKKQVNTASFGNGVTGSRRHLYTPVSRPRLIGGQLQYTNQCGDTVTIYRKNDQIMAKIG
ncbi:MAG: hypothetical protein AAF840_18325 [Bacteroidota bacterium]